MSGMDRQLREIANVAKQATPPAGQRDVCDLSVDRSPQPQP